MLNKQREAVSSVPNSDIWLLLRKVVQNSLNSCTIMQYIIVMDTVFLSSVSRLAASRNLLLSNAVGWSACMGVWHKIQGQTILGCPDKILILLRLHSTCGGQVTFQWVFGEVTGFHVGHGHVVLGTLWEMSQNVVQLFKVWTGSRSINATPVLLSCL